MTISYIEPVITYVSSGNGAYPFTFKVLAESDIEVWYTSASTGARVQLVRGSDFSVTVSNPGGTVTILDNAPAGGQILIERRVPIDQPTDWVNNGPFDMDLLEADLDRIIMIVQQLGWDVSSGQAAINYRGPWAATTTYTIRDIVRTSNGNYYFCIVGHTSGTFATDLAAGNWVLLIDFEAIETHATNAAASATNALASRNTAIARSAAAEADAAIATAAAAAAAADADEIRDWPVSTGLATDVAEHLAFSRKNLLINGGFDVWQRGTSFNVGNSYKYTADRWYAYCPRMGAGTIFERGSFAIGQDDVPSNPTHYLRCTMDAGASPTAGVLQYRVPDVSLLSGRTVTFSVYTRADDTKYIAVNSIQHFGSGGSGNTAVYTYAEKTILNTSWVRKSFTFTMPSVSGKTIGAGDTYTAIYIFMSYDGASVSGYPSGYEMANQEGVFDFANVQLEFGDTATDFEYRHPAEELMLCQRYYETGSDGIPKVANMLSTTILRVNAIPFKVTKRMAPVMTIGTLTPSGHDGTPGPINAIYQSTDEFCAQWDWTGGTAGRAVSAQFTWAADAEIY